MLMKRRDKLSDEELAAYLDDMLSPSYDVDEVYERDCDYDDASCCCFEPETEQRPKSQRKRIRLVSSGVCGRYFFVFSFCSGICVLRLLSLGLPS